MTQRHTHWTHAGLTFVLTILGAGILLPLVRVQPEAVHKYFNGLNDLIKVSFAFFLSLIFTSASFRLMSPRIGHLANWKSYPPAWLAALAAWIVIAIWDVAAGFDTDGYRATAREWLGYGGGSLLIVGWYSGLWTEAAQFVCKRPKPPADPIGVITLQEVENAPWTEIQEWLSSDAPSRYDFLGNRGVADRVSRLLVSGTRSVGIVGAFGAGKTSLVTWITERLTSDTDRGRRVFVCYHSCWGFETSSSAVQEILGSAVSKVSEVIDTFQVDSLPESYRKTFSAGGDWIETVSNLILRSPDPMEQFERLSGLLQDIGGTMVFIVEDLDRNDTRTFEIQEVLAFLERLKPFPNLSFVLTGGLSSSRRIDYAKLCDHIEYLRTIQPHHSSSLVLRLFERCHDQNVFPHESLGGTDQQHHWNPLSGLMMRDYEELSFAQSVASLLNTPRSVRHTLGRTYVAWQTLHGEIDFHHLLAVNVLRFGAPECFQFLVRRWERLHAPPNRQPSFGPERLAHIRQAIVDDWNRTIQNVEWNPTAALKVMEFILPSTEYWLVDESRPGHPGNGHQCVVQERYWVRALNESLNVGEVRDQVVIRDIQGWLNAPGTDSKLVRELTTSSPYSDVWEDLAGRFFGDKRDRIMLLCEHVLSRILREQGSSASDDSQGFVQVWRFANRRIRLQAENKAWLMDRITEAASVSVEMVNGLWHYFGDSGQYSVLRSEDAEPVRRHVLDTLRAQVTDYGSLIARLAPTTSGTLYQLVFDPSTEGNRILNDLRLWSWLGPIVLQALRSRNVTVAANCGVLLGARVSGRERMAVDREVLNEFFGDAASEVIDILDEMVAQLPEGDQDLVKKVVGAARLKPSEANEPNEEGGEVDAN